MEAWRTNVLKEAESWLRTPWQHRQRVKGAGVDCAQFLIGVYSNVGLVQPFETEAYPPDWMMHRDEERFLMYIEKYMNKVEVPLPGDAVVWSYGRCFSHGGIVTDWPRIIHSYRKERGVVRGDSTQGELAERPALFYTPKEA